MQERSKRFSLSQALDVFQAYKKRGHKLILELKTLGAHENEFAPSLERLKSQLLEAGAREAVAVSSLSPGILMNTHQVIPEMPLILNGGIVPGFSYRSHENVSQQNQFPDRSDKRHWQAVGLKPFGELVICFDDQLVLRPDGEGIQTGYLLAKLPQPLLEVLQGQHREGHKLGGLVSLSAVTIFASFLQSVGASETASKLRRDYRQKIDDLNVGKMATTWGQSLSNLPGFTHLSPQEQLATFKQELGSDTLIYTKAPETFAHQLPSEKQS
jgi:hypothetical protein